MTTLQKNLIEERLNSIRKAIDRWDEKMDVAEANGDMEKYAKCDKRQDFELKRLDGMESVLRIMGYCVIQGKDGEPWYIREI